MLLYARAPLTRFCVTETTLRTGDSSGVAGIVLASENGSGHLRAGLNRAAGEWRICLDERELQAGRMPQAFLWEGWHALRMERNGQHVSLFLDGLPLSDGKSGAAWKAPARPGLYRSSEGVEFGTVTCTRGWDEFGEAIRAWGAALAGTPQEGNWSVDTAGLYAAVGETTCRSFKGDMLPAYEYSVQLRFEDAVGGGAGVYAVYVDEANYLAMRIGVEYSVLRVSGMRGGVVLPAQDIAIPPRLRARRSRAEQGCNLCIQKLSDRVIIAVDGMELFSMPGTWPSSQVGLIADTDCHFDGITLFEREQNSSVT